MLHRAHKPSLPGSDDCVVFYSLQCLHLPSHLTVPVIGCSTMQAARADGSNPSPTILCLGDTVRFRA